MCQILAFFVKGSSVDNAIKGQSGDGNVIPVGLTKKNTENTPQRTGKACDKKCRRKRRKRPKKEKIKKRLITIDKTRGDNDGGRKSKQSNWALEGKCNNITCLNDILEVLKIDKDAVQNYIQQKKRLDARLSLAGFF